MAIAAMITMTLLLAMGASAARPVATEGATTMIKAASSCPGITTPQDCDNDTDCTWCMGKGDIGTGCYAIHMARNLPRRFFLCDNDARSVATTAKAELKSVSDCVGATNATACNSLKDSCTWCAGTGNVGTGCYPLAMARALPKRFFTCDNDPRSVAAAGADNVQAQAEEEEEEKEEEEVEEDGAALVGGVSDCVGVKESATCDAKNGCTWCVGTGGSGDACYPVGAARMLPKRWFECDNDSRS